VNYYTSDLHFYHKNIVSFTERGRDTTIEKHEEWLMDLWNSTVTPQDTVYHLGDFSFKHLQVPYLLANLNGWKHFVEGNHDPILKAGESLVHVSKLHNIRVVGNKTVICHYPLAAWEGSGRGVWHLHGHSHGNYQTQGKILDVGLDSAYKIFGKHKFFTEQDIVDYMATRSIYTPETHRRNDV
jgi:calcineurin-like phosphoesterase family protein